MARFRMSWLAVAARVLEKSGVPPERVAKAVERLSAAYRAGAADVGYSKRPTRLAYACHLLPAHVCDIRRVLEVAAGDVLDDPRPLAALALGGGPGAETLALLDAVSERAESGDPRPASLAVVRADRMEAWDDLHAALVPEALAELAVRDRDLAAWVDVDAPTLGVDLSAPPAPAALLEAAAGARLITIANVVSEVIPRAVPRLARGFVETIAAVAARAPAGARLVVIDRAGSPGLSDRVGALVDGILAARPGATAGSSTRVKHRCGCAFPKALVPLYAKVAIPTTKVEDRPVRNCDTLWIAIDLR